MFLNNVFLRGGVVSTSPNPQAGGPPLVGCPRLLIQFIRSYSPYRRPFLYPQTEDASCRGDRDPLTQESIFSEIICNDSKYGDSRGSDNTYSENVSNDSICSDNTYGESICIESIHSDIVRSDSIRGDSILSDCIRCDSL